MFVVATVLTLSTNSTHGALVTLNASADTFITNHAGLGGASANHNDRNNMWCIKDIDSYSAFPMLSFDLAGYAGRTVMGDATFQAYVYGWDNNSWNYHNDARQVQLGVITQAWDPTTVTYDSFGPPLSAGVDWSSDLVASVTWSESDHDPHYVTWTVPQAVAQGWIDNPSTNHGVMLWNKSPYAYNYDLIFQTLEYGLTTTPRPPFFPAQLLFSTDSAVVPEPLSVSIWALLGLFGVAMSWRRRRRSPDSGNV